MGRRLVIGDIHNCYKGIKQAIERANVTSEDELIFNGDYLDGWSQSRETLEYLWRLESVNKCTFIMGNHDEWVLMWLENKFNWYGLDCWLSYGGEATKKSLDKWFEEDQTARLKLTKWLKDLKPYHIDEDNRLFVHAGFKSFSGVEEDYNKTPSILWWDRTLVEGCFANSELFLRKAKLYKEIYVGHTPTTRLSGLPTDKPLRIENINAIDTAAAYFGRVTVMDVETKDYWQSDPVRTLYPNELGRNKS